MTIPNNGFTRMPIEAQAQHQEMLRRTIFERIDELNDLLDTYSRRLGWVEKQKNG